MANWAEQASSMNNKQLVTVGIIALAAIFLLKGLNIITVDPGYMLGDSEFPEESTSTDDRGGTLYWEQKPISGPNYPYFTGGTFLRPQYLPPVRTYHLQ